MLRPSFVWWSLFVMSCVLASGRVYACPAGVLCLDICGSASSPGDGSCPGPVDPLSPSFTSGTTPLNTGAEVDAVQVQDGSGNSVQIPVSPNHSVPTPSGWTPPTAPGGSPTPPSSVSPVVMYGISTSYCSETGFSDYASAGAACASYINGHLPDPGTCNGGTNPSYAYGGVAGTLAYFTVTCSAGPARGDLGGTAASTSTCPTGYTSGSGTCNLSNSSVVAKPVDNVVGMTRSGNVITADPNDPDYGASPSTSSSKLFVGGSGTSSIAAGSAGLGGVVTVDVGSGGATTITATKDNGNGTSTQTVISVGAPDGSGNTKVTGVTAGTIQGSGSLAASGSPTASTQKDPCGLPTTSPCKIDETGVSDSAHAGSSFSSLKSSYDNYTTQANAGASSGDLSPFGVPKYTVPADGSSGIANPFAGAPASCTNPDIKVWGVTYTPDVCSIIASFRSLLFWFLNVLVAFYAWGAYSRRGSRVG